ncbi:MAG TPA: hypothetical protein VK797_13955 [Tepidisphaeraceae bacterium]|jgi:hypothetical protein|nr:hypothetical protein [Tepidisphaeraceae bacterium]
MDELWHRTLGNLRDNFRSNQNPDAPLLNYLIEEIQTQPSEKGPLPALLPKTKYMREGGAPFDEPRPLAVSDWLVPIPANRVRFRDQAGKEWAALSYGIDRRMSLRCEADQINRFLSLAEDAGQAMRNTPQRIASQLPETVRELCVRNHNVRRYRFGAIENEPQKWMTDGGYCGVCALENGVVIDFVSKLSPPNGSADWILLLHRLAWYRYQMPRLQASRVCWGGDHGGLRVHYELVHPKKAIGPIDRIIEKVDPTRWFSIIGDDNPLDLFEASARAVEIILEYARTADVVSGESKAESFQEDNLENVTPRQKEILKLLKRLKNGQGLEGKEIAAKLPKQHRKDESTLRRHDFPAMIRAGLIVNTPGVGYHLPASRQARKRA